MSDARLQRISEKLHLNDDRRRILSCVGGDCARNEVQPEAWALLQTRLAELAFVANPMRPDATPE